MTTTPHATDRRQRLENDREAIVHRFSIAGHEGYLHVGLYSDGRPGEIFVKMSKQGSTIAGLMDGIALLTSIGLQYGVPLGVLVEKMRYTRFEPMGICDGEIGVATSVLDYIFHYLQLRFLPPSHEVVELPEMGSDVIATLDPTRDL